MTRFRATSSFVALAFAVLVLAEGANAQEEAPNNDSVGQEIDDITRPPDYDWLRNGDRFGDGPGSGKPRKGGPAKIPKRKRQDLERGSDCGYKPEPQDGKGADDPVNLPKGQGGCGNEVGPGSDPLSAPPAPEASEGCARAPMDCGGGCEGGGCGGGDCAGGGMGQLCGSCGQCTAAAPIFGYALAFAALVLVVILIVRAIAGRRGKEDVEVEELSEDPGEVRMSKVQAMPSRSMLDRAAEAAAQGDYKTAVGWAYLAGISRLHRWGYTDLDQSTTNWTIVSSVRRRGGPHKPAARLIRIFEDLFFGGREPSLAHWEECKRLLEEELDQAPVDQS